MEESVLQSLGLIIITAACLLLLGRFLKVPGIVLYILAGLLIGPLSGLVTIGDVIHLISETGIVLLLFLVGMEISLDKIRDVGKVTLVAGFGQVLVTGLAGSGLALLLGFEPLSALFLAIGLTFSSTVVVIKLLDSKGELYSTHGRIAVGVLIIQDLIVILLLTILNAVGNESGSGGLLISLAKAFGGLTLLLGLTTVASKYILPKPFSWAARSPDMLFVWSLAWCFLIVAVAKLFSLSLEVGAFLAGVALAQLPYSEELRRKVHPIVNFFLAVFFVSLGAGMDFTTALENKTTALIISVFVLIFKPLMFFLSVGIMGFGKKTTFYSGMSLAQISEFSFIFISLGVSASLIPGSILSITATVGILTIAVSSYLILYTDKLYKFAGSKGLLKFFPEGKDITGQDGHEHLFHNHIIIAGMNELGRQIANELHKRGETVLAIDTDPEKLKDLPCNTMIGSVDYDSVLESASFHKAKLIISALHIEDTNNLLAHRARMHGIPASIHAFDPTVKQELERIGVDYLILPKENAIQKQLQVLESEGIL